MEKKILLKIHKSCLKILDEIDRVCKENNINYFLVGGTLLGAIRHKGFIPWDDDLDIGMTREEYDKFIKIAPSKLSNDFVLDDISTNKDYWLTFAKVRLKKSIFEESTYKEKCEYKGNKGIWVDIFPIDSTNHFKDKYIKLKFIKIKLKKILYARRCKKYTIHKKIREYIYDFLALFLKPFSIKSINNNILKDMIKENKKDCKYFVNYGSQYGVVKQTHLKEKIFPLSKVVFEGKEYPAPKDPDYYLRNIYGDNYMELPPKEKQVTHNPKRIVFEDGEEIIFDET